MKLLFVDLETLETTDPDIIQDIADNIHPPGTIKLEKSIDKWNEEKRPAAIEEAVSKTSFDGFAGSICSISWAVNDGEIQSLYRANTIDDFNLINSFWRRLIHQNGVNFNPVWCGHNITGFDLRFLFKRCVVHQIKPSIILPYNDKPWSKNVFDTLFETTGDLKSGGSLNKVAKALGLKGKSGGLDGSMINQAFLDGRIDEIVKYNVRDVEITRNIYKRLLFLDSVADTQRPEDFK